MEGSLEEMRALFSAAKTLGDTPNGKAIYKLAREMGAYIGGSREHRRILSHGAKLYDPWKCGRCGTHSRAVLGTDRRPACLACKGKSPLAVVMNRIQRDLVRSIGESCPEWQLLEEEAA